jgi:hypothetical protein
MRRIWRQLARLLARFDQSAVGHWIVVRFLPPAIRMRFDPESAKNLEATLELAIRHPRGGDPVRFSLAIADAQCSVRAGAPPRPGARAVVGSDDLILLASGAASWPELLSSGRFELSGDPFLALRFASLFKLPVELDPV